MKDVTGKVIKVGDTVVYRSGDHLTIGYVSTVFDTFIVVDGPTKTIQINDSRKVAVV